MDSHQLAQLQVPGLYDDSERVEVAAPSGLAPVVREGGDIFAQAFASTIFNYIFYTAIVLAVLFIMWSGVQLITSQGDVERLQAAKRRLVFAVIGLVIVLLSFLIVNVVITLIGGDSAKFFAPQETLNQTTTP